MDPTVRQLYGGKTRIRVCGLCIQADQILLVNHVGLRDGDFWAPPGGGMEFGETAPQALEREFREETGLEIRVGQFLFVCELVSPPLHSVELFFEVTALGGEVRTGADPESGAKQAIKNVGFYSFRHLDGFQPGSLHGIFSYAPEKAQINSLRGYFKL